MQFPCANSGKMLYTFDLPSVNSTQKAGVSLFLLRGAQTANLGAQKWTQFKTSEENRGHLVFCINMLVPMELNFGAHLGPGRC